MTEQEKKPTTEVLSDTTPASEKKKSWKERIFGSFVSIEKPPVGTEDTEASEPSDAQVAVVAEQLTSNENVLLKGLDETITDSEQNTLAEIDKRIAIIEAMVADGNMDEQKALDTILTLKKQKNEIAIVAEFTTTEIAATVQETPKQYDRNRAEEIFQQIESGAIVMADLLTIPDQQLILDILTEKYDAWMNADKKSHKKAEAEHAKYLALANKIGFSSVMKEVPAKKQTVTADKVKKPTMVASETPKIVNTDNTVNPKIADTATLHPPASLNSSINVRQGESSKPPLPKFLLRQQPEPVAVLNTVPVVPTKGRPLEPELVMPIVRPLTERPATPLQKSKETSTGLTGEYEALSRLQKETVNSWTENPLNRTAEVQNKFAWFEAYKSLMGFDMLKQQADALRKKWAQADGAGEDYDENSNNFKLQTGEALKQMDKLILKKEDIPVIQLHQNDYRDKTNIFINHGKKIKEAVASNTISTEFAKQLTVELLKAVKKSVSSDSEVNQNVILRNITADTTRTGDLELAKGMAELGLDGSNKERNKAMIAIELAKSGKINTEEDLKTFVDNVTDDYCRENALRLILPNIVKNNPDLANKYADTITDPELKKMAVEGMTISLKKENIKRTMKRTIGKEIDELTASGILKKIDQWQRTNSLTSSFDINEAYKQVITEQKISEQNKPTNDN